MEKSYCVDKRKVGKCIEDSFKSFMSKYFGKGPRLARAYLVEDIVIIYCEDFLTTLEKNYAKDEKSQCYVHIMRRKMSEDYREEILRIVESQTGYEIKDIYVDYKVSKNSLCCVFRIDI